MEVPFFSRFPGGLDWALSVIGVLIFAGLTAWDTQKIKEMYDSQDDHLALSGPAEMLQSCGALRAVPLYPPEPAV